MVAKHNRENGENMISVIVPTRAIYSDEQTRLILQQTSKHELIHAAEGDTPGEARNIAAKKAVGDTLVFLDDDCYPTNRRWLESLTENGGITSGRIITPDTFIGRFIRRMGGLGTPDLGTKPKYIDSAPSTNLAIPKRVFKRLGGFRGDLVVGEDIDLCERLKKAGYKIRYEPSAMVLHKQEHIFRRAYHGAKHTARQRMMRRKTMFRLGILPAIVIYAGLCVMQPLLLVLIPLGLVGVAVKYSIYAPMYVFHLICESAGAWRGKYG